MKEAGLSWFRKPLVSGLILRGNIGAMAKTALEAFQIAYLRQQHLQLKLTRVKSRLLLTI